MNKTTHLSYHYDHQSWESRRRFLRFLMRVIGFPFLLRLDRVDGIENIPAEGPAILMMNHIAFVDSLVVVHTVPRNIVPLAKIEVFDYPVVGLVPQLWGVIPVQRDGVDRQAIQRSLAVLRAGEILLVAPEGTRNSVMQEGKEGVAYLASRTGSPVIPVAIEGTEGFPAFRLSSRWKLPGAIIRFGRPLRYHPDLQRARTSTLRKMTDEAMYILAGMLPENRRGFYADLSMATSETIQYI